MFSAGEDKQVKCWDLEYNKVIYFFVRRLQVFGPNHWTEFPIDLARN